jgi:DNA-binding transcriptional regulator/RsmH inhibitor MraZ
VGAYRVHIEHLFGGSALKAVDGHGRVQLPRFVRATAERRSDDRTLVLGPHGADACLTAYDRGYRKQLFAEAERLRLRDESAGTGEGPHHGRARRAFGLTEESRFDDDGRIVLPAMMRRLGRIEGLALFVGTGGAVEIWNPHLAAESDDEALRELARYRLGQDDQE